MNHFVSGTQYSKTERRKRRVARAEVLKRDKKCRRCHKRKAVVAAHIKAVRDGGKTTKENMRGLCKRCHNKEGIERGEIGRKSVARSVKTFFRKLGVI